MKSKKFGNVYVLRIDKGEEIIESLSNFCKEENILLGSVQGIGALGSVEMGVFHPKEKQYESHTLNGDYEIVSLIGNVSTKDNEVYLHLHINIADHNNNSFGGHLNKAVISATCEIILTTIEGQVDRFLSDEIGLNLFKL